MIVGIGTDIILCSRLKKWENNLTLGLKVFHPREWQYAHRCREPYRYLVRCFIVKEAFVKALGFGFASHILPNKIEVSRQKNGKPYIVWHIPSQEKNKILFFSEIHVSLSHEKEYAVATVILEK